jgi:hypothetical protein
LSLFYFDSKKEILKKDGGFNGEGGNKN